MFSTDSNAKRKDRIQLKASRIFRKRLFAPLGQGKFWSFLIIFALLIGLLLGAPSKSASSATPTVAVCNDALCTTPTTTATAVNNTGRKSDRDDVAVLNRLGNPSAAPNIHPMAGSLPSVCTPTLYASDTFVTTTGNGFMGSDTSVVDAGHNLFGLNGNYFYNFQLADDFTVNSMWAPNKLTFYAYQIRTSSFPPTSRLGEIASLTLWDGVPGGGGTILARSSGVLNFTTGWTNTYRVTSTTLTDAQRAIMYVQVDWPSTFPDTLLPGTYWLAWSFIGNDGPIYVPPANLHSTDNSRLYDSPNWIDSDMNSVLDGVQSVDFPFAICGSIGPANTRTPTSTATMTHTPVPVPPDTIGVYNAGMWYLRNTNNTGEADITAVFGGDLNDLPVVGDWNNDGVDTIGVYRNSTGFFFLSDSNTSPAANHTVLFGNPGDTPFAGHWTVSTNGSGIGVYRNSNGILYGRISITPIPSEWDVFFAVFGNPGDKGFAGDWNGDGFDSVGIYRPSNQTWYLTNNSTPYGITFSDINFVWDIGTNAPVVGDWNGDRTSTVGYFTALGVFDLHSTNASTGTDNVFDFGPSTGMPVAGKWSGGSTRPLSGVIGNRQSSSSSSNDSSGGD